MSTGLGCFCVMQSAFQSFRATIEPHLGVPFFYDLIYKIIITNGTTGTWQIITNGNYKSCQHRAITNASKPRLSVATFHDPAKTMTVSPAFKPPRYHQVVYGDYVSSWYTKGPNGKRNIDALLI